MGQQFIAHDGTSTTIKDRYLIVWYEETQCVALFDGTGERTYRMNDTRSERDDKFFVPFIRSEIDFRNFVLFLACVHGLDVETVKEPALSKPANRFVKK